MEPTASPPSRLDRFLHPSLRSGGPGEMRRARAAVVQGLVGSAGLLLTALLLWLGDLPAATVVQALAAAATVGLSLVWIRTRGDVAPAACVATLAIALTPIAQAALDHGIFDPALALFAVAPIGAAMVSGRRLALVTLAVGVLGTGALYAQFRAGIPAPALSPVDQVALWTFLIIVAAGVLSLLAGVLYVRHTDAALDDAERRAAALRASLSASEVRHQTLVENIPVGIYRTSVDGTILFANPATAAILGAPSVGAVTGLDVADVYRSPEHRLAFKERMDADGLVQAFETPIRRCDGRTAWVRLSGRAVCGPDGAVAHYEGIVEDVTVARDAAAAIRQRDARYRALVRRSSDATLVVGRDGRVVYASPAVEALLGRTPAAVTGRDASALVHAAHHDTLRALYDGPAEGRAASYPVDELTLAHADGHSVVVDGVATDLCDDPAVAGVVLNLRDATERKRAEAALRMAKQHAEEVAELKSTFLANMSHEIRTPLTAILGFADVLADEVEEPELREFVELIAQGGRRLMDTLNSVLELARLDAGGGDLTLEPTVVAEAVAEAVQLLQPQARARGLALVAQIEAPEASASLDDGALGRVLHNLIGNALKFTDEGGVTVAVRADATHVAVVVRDTGIGIEPAFLPRLFGEFEQASAGVGRTHEGAGLGLAIAQQLVGRMGGTITVESTVGVGTVFEVRLPRLGAAPAPEDARLPVALVVDDNEQALAVASRVLAGAYRVVAAPHAAAALAAARADRPDVAVLDINLGAGADGAALLALLRAEPGLAGLPAVAVTAFGLPGDRERYLAAGFDAFVTKPYTRDRLLGTVAEIRLLDGARALAG